MISAPVGHEPRSLELPHVGVDKRVPGLSSLPSLQRTGVVQPPLLSSVTPRAPQVEDGVAVLDGAVAEEVPPQELKNEPIGGVVGHALPLVFSDLRNQEGRVVVPRVYESTIYRRELACGKWIITLHQT